jgi:hypothetical protein
MTSNLLRRKLGRFSVEVHLKRQKRVLHGAEARVLKHIPKIIFKVSICLLFLDKNLSEIQGEHDVQKLLAALKDPKSIPGNNF